MLGIIAISGFIIDMNLKGKYSGITNPELTSCFNRSAVVANSFNLSRLEEIELNIRKYPDYSNDSIFNHASRIIWECDTFNLIIDRLVKKPDSGLATAVVEKLKLFSDTTYLLLGFIEPEFSNVFGVNTMEFDPKPFEETPVSTKKKQLQKLHLSLIRNAYSLLSNIRINYFENKTKPNTVDENWWTPRPALSKTCINPVVGENITSDVFISGYSNTPYIFEHWINGKKHEPVDGVIHYKTRFSKPGKYPFHYKIQVSDWKTDSTKVFEKTYCLNVSE